MAIEPISEIGGAATATALATDYLHVAHPTPGQVGLAAAKEKEGETTEQRAANGDPIALSQLAHEQARVVPIEAQQLLPIQSNHPPGAHEEGKGILIDIYD